MSQGEIMGEVFGGEMRISDLGITGDVQPGQRFQTDGLF